MIAVKMKTIIPKGKNQKKLDTDVIVDQVKEVEEIDEHGVKTIKSVRKKVNLTKLINETAKIVKQSAVITAEEKLKEMQKIFTK